MLHMIFSVVLCHLFFFFKRKIHDVSYYVDNRHFVEEDVTVPCYLSLLMTSSISCRWLIGR